MIHMATIVWCEQSVCIAFLHCDLCASKHHLPSSGRIWLQVWNKASYLNRSKEHGPCIDETLSNHERLSTMLALKEQFKGYTSSEADLDLPVRPKEATTLTREIAFDLLVSLCKRLKANIDPLALHL